MRTLIVGVLVLEATMRPPRPLTVERIVRKLAELSEGGTRAVCLTCERGSLDRERKYFAHDHSDEIAKIARATYPFFEECRGGGFWLGSRGYFFVPHHIIGPRGNMFPGWEDCVNFPISEV
jgi:hypothetical protein